MHEGQSLLNARGLTAKAQLSAPQPVAAAVASQLKIALTLDAGGYLRHSFLALAEGVAGAQADLSSWSTVQMYYSVFYCARAFLATQDVCIFYGGRTPYSLVAAPGAVSLKLKGNTHQATLDEFSRLNSNSFYLSQQIELEEPLNWLRAKREIANYNLASPIEPGIYEHFRFAQRIGIRKAVNSYIEDMAAAYTFDKDHAILAYPLRFLKDTIANAKLAGILSLTTHLELLCTIFFGTS